MRLRERKIFTAALVAVGSTILAHQTYQNREKLRGPLVGLVKKGLDYDRKVEQGTIREVDIRIPGRWKVADVIAEVLANPGSSWVDIRRYIPPLNRDTLSTEARSCALPGLFLLRTYAYPRRETTKVGDYTEAISVTRLVGTDILPIHERFIDLLDDKSNKAL